MNLSCPTSQLPNYDVKTYFLLIFILPCSFLPLFNVVLLVFSLSLYGFSASLPQVLFVSGSPTYTTWIAIGHLA